MSRVKRIITAACYIALLVLVFKNFDLIIIREFFFRTPLRTLFILMILVFSGYVLRIIRWHFMTRGIVASKHSFIESSRVVLLGLAAGVITPMRSGELLKTWWLGKQGLPYSSALGIVLIERGADFGILLGLSLFGSKYINVSFINMRAVYFILFGLVALIIFILFSYKKVFSIVKQETKVYQVAKWLNEQAEHWKQVPQKWQVIARAFSFSILVWVIEMARFEYLLKIMKIKIPLMDAVFLYPLSILSSLFSLIPAEGMVGGSQVFLLKYLAGVNIDRAVILATIDRSITLVPLLCLAVFLKKRVVDQDRDSIKNN